MAERNYSTRGEAIRSPFLSEKEKKEVNVLDSSIEQQVLYSGERTFVKFIRKAEKLLNKNRLSYDYEDGTFILYSERFDSDYYRNLNLTVEDNCFVLTDEGSNRQLYVTEYADLQEMIDYLFINYSSSYKPNGLILTR